MCTNCANDCEYLRLLVLVVLHPLEVLGRGLLRGRHRVQVPPLRRRAPAARRERELPGITPRTFGGGGRRDEVARVAPGRLRCSRARFERRRESPLARAVAAAYRVEREYSAKCREKQT